MSDTADFYDDDVFAAEYALGVLDGAGRSSAARRIRRDSAFARMVEEWETRLAPMLTTIAPVEPPAGLWQAIDADLARIARVRAALTPAATPEGRVSRLWQWFGLGSFGLLAASLAMLFVLTQPRPQPGPLTATLAAEGAAAPLYTAVVYPGATSATLVPVAAAADPARSQQLWLIEPEKPPVSLGLLSATAPLRIDISREQLAKGGILAISLEPLGGSPTGLPTGPVVATGELKEI
jgi:anti-sigma-K factor RskA